MYQIFNLNEKRPREPRERLSIPHFMLTSTHKKIKSEERLTASEVIQALAICGAVCFFLAINTRPFISLVGMCVSLFIVVITGVHGHDMD